MRPFWGIPRCFLVLGRPWEVDDWSWKKSSFFPMGKKTTCLVTLVLLGGVPLESKSINISFSGWSLIRSISTPGVNWNFFRHTKFWRKVALFLFFVLQRLKLFCSSQVSNRFHLWILKASRIWWWQLKYFDYFQPDFWGDDPILTNVFFEMGWNHMWNHQLEKYCRSFFCWHPLMLVSFTYQAIEMFFVFL